jgi:outer membrane protein TolC
MKRIYTKLLLLIFISSASFASQQLSLENYLSQVEAGNPDVKAINASIEASELKMMELDMVYSSLFSGGYNYLKDKSGASFGSTLPTDEMTVNSWNLGLNKKLDFGTNLSVGYTNTDADFRLLAPTTIIPSVTLTNFTGYEIKPYFSFQQSLLRDYKSGLTKSGINKAKALSKSGQYIQLFKKQQILLQARSVYWALSLDREIVEFRKLSLDRAEKIFQWTDDKVKLDLAEKSDFYQSQAAFKLRQLNLKMSIEDEEKSRRDFNQYRGISGDVVFEDLTRISDMISYYSNISELASMGMRADVLAAKELFNSSKFAKKETYYRSLPEVSLNGTYSVHGLGLNYNDAWNQVTGLDKPEYGLGISFIVPLDQKTLVKVQKGYTLDYQSSQDTVKKSELSMENDWNQLKKTWLNVKERINLALEIKDIQNLRVTNEMDRFKRGRTTTFLLLSAQTDLDDATINVYRLIYEEIMTFAQAELYNTKELK